jgi:phage-related protein
MSHAPSLTPLVWVGSAKRDLLAFPPAVAHSVGFVLMRVQYGDRPPHVKVLRGFGGASVLEVIQDYDGNTYRAVYTVRFRGRVYVLHAFQKRSKHGIATPKTEIALIRTRLAWAAKLHEEWERQYPPTDRT